MNIHLVFYRSTFAYREKQQTHTHTFSVITIFCRLFCGFNRKLLMISIRVIYLSSKRNIQMIYHLKAISVDKHVRNMSQQL